MSHCLPWGASPIDLAEEEPGEVKFLDEQGEVPAPDPEIGAQERMAAWTGTRGGLGWAMGTLGVSTLALLALNSHALANWANQLPVTPASDPIVERAEAWHTEAGRWGLNSVVDRVEQAAAAMRKAKWPSAPAPKP
ncbi:hypothetical protein [Novosphingobium humi]|uniref:Uncharacterized protein n=1 Tax=Novosphingobium humi TaxID=2282397 RepID=A0ABY7U429_9SPHN|nr:hypothetical protein [Novosphingobium humi]WCT80254.1 hypothetical protein PQ457_22175 [Novosphingobium humi]